MEIMKQHNHFHDFSENEPVILMCSHGNSNHKLQEEFWDIIDKTKLLIKEEGMPRSLRPSSQINKCICILEGSGEPRKES